MKDKYVAFFAANCESETFETFEAAEKWLTDGYDSDEGYSEETMNGFDYIAEITHRSKFTETDKKENYHEHNDDCAEDCDEEEWPYNNLFDVIGGISMEKIGE
jgi:hypothetical protein